MKAWKNMNDELPPDTRTASPETQPLQLFFSFSGPETNNQQSRRNNSTTVTRLSDPAIPVGITKFGTHVAKLDHMWRAARTCAKRHNYKLLEMYGVIGSHRFVAFKLVHG